MTPPKTLRGSLEQILDTFACRMWHEGYKSMVHWRDPDFVSEQFVGQISTPLLDAANLMRQKYPDVVTEERAIKRLPWRH